MCIYYTNNTVKKPYYCPTTRENMDKLIDGKYEVKNVLETFSYITVRGMEKLYYRIDNCILIFNSVLTPLMLLIIYHQ